MDAHDVAAEKYADDDPQLEGFGVPSFVEELRAIVQRAMEAALFVWHGAPQPRLFGWCMTSLPVRSTAAIIMRSGLGQ
ncbi:hypothetical protein TcBrA4_0072730 [Trypanosoma cruzi]|nr:hypothetical protein TcBrA4_0072730 [Trypanosoma cruzi]